MHGDNAVQHKLIPGVARQQSSAAELLCTRGHHGERSVKPVCQLQSLLIMVSNNVTVSKGLRRDSAHSKFVTKSTSHLFCLCSHQQMVHSNFRKKSCALTVSRCASSICHALPWKRHLAQSPRYCKMKCRPWWQRFEGQFRGPRLRVCGAPWVPLPRQYHQLQLVHVAG